MSSARNVLADSPGQHEADPALAHLLVLAHVVKKRGHLPLAAAGLRQRRRQANAGQVVADALGIRGRAQAKTHRQLEGKAHADGDGFAMMQRVVEIVRGLKRVAEGMAEIEKGPRTCFAFVGGDNRRLRLARP